jgi:hypothetical protein
MTGYDLTKDYPSLSNEQIIGPSGITYSAGQGSLVKLSDLGTDFSGPFSGDESSSVWFFQTTMPFSELTAVPEPDSIVGVGAIAALAFMRRRRTA